MDGFERGGREAGSVARVEFDGVGEVELFEEGEDASAAGGVEVVHCYVDVGGGDVGCGHCGCGV